MSSHSLKCHWNIKDLFLKVNQEDNSNNKPLAHQSEDSPTHKNTVEKSTQYSETDCDVILDTSHDQLERLVESFLFGRRIQLESITESRARVKFNKLQSEGATLESIIDSLFSDHLEMYEKAQILRLSFADERNKLLSICTNMQSTVNQSSINEEFEYCIQQPRSIFKNSEEIEIHVFSPKKRHRPYSYPKK